MEALTPRWWSKFGEFFGQAQVNLFATRQTLHCPLWFSLTHTAPLGLDANGTDVAEASSVCLSPDRSAPGSSRESAPGWGPSIAKNPVLAGPSLVLWTLISLSTALHVVFPSGGISSHWQRAWSFTPARSCGSCGLAPEGAQLIASGLSTEVAETILQSRAPSMRKLYGPEVETRGAEDRQLDPVNCPFGTVLEFLRRPVSPRVSPSTLKVYVAAIAAYHGPLLVAFQ